MRQLSFIAPIVAGLALAGAAQAQDARVTVTVGPELSEKVEELGQRDIDRLTADLQRVVERELAARGALQGAEVQLVLTDVKPNRPTFTQVGDRPGLDPIRSISIGGAAIEGQVVGPEGARPLEYDWYSTSIQDVRGVTTWFDANRTFDRFARQLAAGRL